MSETGEASVLGATSSIALLYVSFNMTRFYIDGVENMEETLLAMLTNIYNPLFTEENLKYHRKLSLGNRNFPIRAKNRCTEK